MYNWEKLLQDLPRDIIAYLHEIILMPLSLFYVVTFYGFLPFIAIAIYMGKPLPTPIYWVVGIYLLLDIIIVAIDVNDYLKKYKINLKEEEE